MAKIKKVFYCSSCGVESGKWFGRCTSCGEWGSCIEESVSTNQKTPKVRGLISSSQVVSIGDIAPDNYARISTSVGEFDRVLGGGLVAGSMVLLGGEPGIGKSTLALQVALNCEGLRVLYISGEESAEQVRLRGERLGIGRGECRVLCETSVEVILEKLMEEKPQLVVVDSIQTLFCEAIESFAGSVTQVRESAARLLRYAKSSAVPIVLIGHITKEGSIAGPKILEHIVDAVFLFEGDGGGYRLLRGVKNRFGSTSEMGIFEMTAKGLREVESSSEIFMVNHSESVSGVAMGVVMEGSRSYILETQALVCATGYSVAGRSATGLDYKRMSMLVAVLEKRFGFKLQGKDIFLNLVGGFKVGDTGLDLAFVMAMISSILDITVPFDSCFIGEVGLSGEVRSVTRIVDRLREARRMGFAVAVISEQSRGIVDSARSELEGIGVQYVSRVSDLSGLFGR
ncbi:MAG: DNA repair protein RadA [Rikenellaceae bacterium]